MALSSLKSNLGTKGDYFVMQLGETEVLWFYISDLTQQAIT